MIGRITLSGSKPLWQNELLTPPAISKVQCRSDAQDATEKCNIKRKELKIWMNKFRKVARLALADEPQQLEALGIMVPTQKI